MSWFEEQIFQRKKGDDDQLRESLMDAANVVAGRRTEYRPESGESIRTALEAILNYYHLPHREVPESITDLEGQMEYLLRPYGVMYRPVVLQKGWHRNACGPYLVFREGEEEVLQAVLPAGISGYHVMEHGGNVSRRVTAKNEESIGKRGYCFYKPFPQKKLGIPQLLLYIKSCLTIQDILPLVLFSLATVLIGFIIPRTTGLLVGEVLQSKDITVLLGMAILMFSATVSKLFMDQAKALATGCIQTRLNLEVESAAMMRVLSLPTGFFHKYSSGDLSSRVSSVSTLCTTLTDLIFTTGLSSVMSLLYITQIFRYAPALLIPCLILIAARIIFSIVTVFAETRRQRIIMEENAESTGISFSIINAMQKIRLAGAEKRAFSRWAGIYNEVAALSYNPPLLLKINAVINTAIGLAETIILYSVALTAKISVADYSAFMAAYGMISGTFTQVIGLAGSFAMIDPILNMARPILETEPETQGNREVVTELGGNIELQNLSFRYTETGPWIIDDLSLRIRKGEYVAIVGSTGCGKSTLVRLLLGFVSPGKGTIFYDGRNIDTLDLRSLRSRIGTVMQNGSLFNDSIYANIVISAPMLTVDQAWEAAEIAGIADDIRMMPMGMHTIISEGQGGISGGQKQRLMIARAVAPKPSVLIFDEATSALDNLTQKKVTDSLDALKCTRIVIAHRLSTIQNCDRILYLGNGKILEEGTYEELIDKNGLFAEMVARQRL